MEPEPYVYIIDYFISYLRCKMMTIQKSKCKLGSHASEFDRTNWQKYIENPCRAVHLLKNKKWKKEIFLYEICSIYSHAECFFPIDYPITQLHITIWIIPNNIQTLVTRFMLTIIISCFHSSNCSFNLKWKSHFDSLQIVGKSHIFGFECNTPSTYVTLQNFIAMNCLV